MTKEELKRFSDAMDRQNGEFDALVVLRDKFRRLCMTPVVDDDYPEERHGYESALRSFLRAVQTNRGEDYFKGL